MKISIQSRNVRTGRAVFLGIAAWAAAAIAPASALAATESLRAAMNAVPQLVEARHSGRVRIRFGAALGVMLGEVVVRAAIAAPAYVYFPPVRVYCQPPPPPRVHAYYHPLPPPPAPPPIQVIAAPPPEPRYRKVGIGLAAVTTAPRSGQTLEAGIVGVLQMRLTPHIAVGLEGESLGADLLDGTRRRDVGAYGVAQIYLWDAPLTVFLAGAGGLAHASVSRGGIDDQATQLVGKLGGGIELRLGRSVALSAQIMGVERQRLDGGAPGSEPAGALAVMASEGPQAIAADERGTEGRLGAMIRF